MTVLVAFRVKSGLKQKKGVQRDSLPSYLDEFMWRERYGQTGNDAFTKMIAQIALKHPLP